MRVAQDEQAAIAALFRATYPDALAFAKRRVGADGAEDVVAQAYLVVCRRFDQAPEDVSGQRAWVVGIVRNCLLNHRRSRRRQHALTVRLNDPTMDRVCVDDRTLAIDVHSAWHRLSDADREVIALVAIDEFTSDEAASVLGLTPTAYRQRLSRARRRLREYLEVPANGVTS